MFYAVVRFEECLLKVPERLVRGVWRPNKNKAVPEHLRVAVYSGPKQEMIAMATIDMEDLESVVNITAALVFKYENVL